MTFLHCANVLRCFYSSSITSMWTDQRNLFQRGMVLDDLLLDVNEKCLTALRVSRL